MRAWLRIPLDWRGSLNSPSLLQSSRHAGPMVFRHRRLSSYEAGLAISRTHASEEVGRGSHVRLHGVDHAGAGIASNLAEVRILTQVHHRGGVHDAAVITIQIVIEAALYPLLLYLFHRCSSDYIFTPVGCSALVGSSCFHACLVVEPSRLLVWLGC